MDRYISLRETGLSVNIIIERQFTTVSATARYLTNVYLHKHALRFLACHTLSSGALVFSLHSPQDWHWWYVTLAPCGAQHTNLSRAPTAIISRVNFPHIMKLLSPLTFTVLAVVVGLASCAPVGFFPRVPAPFDLSSTAYGGASLENTLEEDLRPPG